MKINGRDVVENPLAQFLENASRAMPNVHQTGNGENARFYRVPGMIGSRLAIDVNQLIADGAPVGPAGIHGVSARPTGENLDVREMIEQHSRVIQAGALAIWATPRDKALIHPPSQYLGFSRWSNPRGFFFAPSLAGRLNGLTLTDHE